MNNSPYKTSGTKTVYQNPWITVREDAIIHPDGKPGIYGVVESKDSVIVAAIDENNRVLLINNFSYVAQKWHWELPAGGTDGDDDFVTTSQRELAEETGVHAKTWHTLAITRVCDGLMTEKMAVLLATDLQQDETPSAYDSALIRDMKFARLDEVHAMIQSGEIDECQTLSALYLLERHLATNG